MEISLKSKIIQGKDILLKFSDGSEKIINNFSNNISIKDVPIGTAELIILWE